MKALNRVTLIGLVGKEPEIRNTTTGKKIANFTMAMSDKYKDKEGNQQEHTEWVNIVVYNPSLVGVIEKYINKGSKLFVEGCFQTRKWTDKSGADRYTTEVVLKAYSGDIILLDGKKQESQAGFIEDEIPF